VQIPTLRQGHDKKLSHFVFAQYDKEIVKLSKGQIVNANTELIPEAPNRKPVILIVEVSVSIAIDVVQVAVPSTV
jgi:hypothetical protein